VKLLAAALVAAFVWVTLETLAGRPLTFKKKAESAGRRRHRNRQIWLSQAGAAVTPAQFWAVCVATAAAAFVVLYAIDRTVIVALLPAKGLGAIPYGYWSQQRRKSSAARFEAWPDALRRVNGSLEHGIFNLHDALEELSISGPEALRPPMSRYVRLVAKGVGDTQALESVRAELADPVSDTVLLTLQLAATQGTATATEVLADLADQITGDLELAEKIRTAQTQSRIAAWGVFLLPYGLLVFLCSTQQFYREFFSQPIGLVVVLAGAAMSLVGFTIVRRLGKPIATVERVFPTTPTGATR
jgi:tight adherence protein B